MSTPIAASLRFFVLAMVLGALLSALYGAAPNPLIQCLTAAVYMISPLGAALLVSRDVPVRERIGLHWRVGWWWL